MRLTSAAKETAGGREAASLLTSRLDGEQVQFFEENGYLRIGALTTAEEAQEIKAALKELFEKRAGEKEGAFADLVAGADHDDEMSSPQILNPVNYIPWLHNTKCFKSALAIARQLLGEEARCFFDLSILKEPRVGAPTPWHQDEAFRDPNFEYRELTVWVALQDVTEDNGCLRFIPKSHRGRVLEHHSANHDPTSQALEVTDSISAEVAVACALPPGGCTLHHHRTLHSAGANVSEIPRFTYIMTFGITPRPIKQDRVFPWLNEKETRIQERKRRWMRRGGVLITIWRRFRRGDLTNWHAAFYGFKRSLRILRKGL